MFGAEFEKTVDERIDEGLRSTLPIWNMPDGGPFHWSANFDELQDFENDIRLGQRNYPQVV